VTDRCNLDCAYCAEYGDSWPRRSLDDLEKWILEIVAPAKRALDLITFFKLANQQHEVLGCYRARWNAQDERPR
jgi:molybdenum cofactor biosynthesis enzyme MoaA